MALRLVLGGPGSGKTMYCVREVMKKRGRRRECIFIVPEQSAVLAERDFITKSGGSGFMDVHVLSFKRLAFHVFTELGSVDKKILDDMGKAMLLRKVLHGLSGELVCYPGAADKPGFVAEISELISEFKKYSVSLETLGSIKNKLLEREEGSASLKLKLGDIHLILNNYTEYMAKNYISNDDLLDVLAEKLAKAELVRGAEIWIDGFQGFTPQEYRVILRLLEVCDVTVSLHYFGADGGEGLFNDAFNTLARLEKLSEEAGIKTDRVYLDGFPERPPDINYLLERIFTGSTRIFHGTVENITALRTEDVYEELRACASEITKLVREEGFRYKDIAVIMCSRERYEAKLGAVFGHFGIPFFIDTKSSVESHQLAEFMRSALDIVISNRSYDSIFRFLKSGLSGVSVQRVDALENYVLEYGIKGGLWDKDWAFGASRLIPEDESADELEKLSEERERLIMLNETRAYLMRVLKPLLSLRANRRFSVRLMSERLYTVISACRAPERLAASADIFRRSDETLLALRQKQIWGNTVALLDKLVEILGEQEVTPLEYAGIISAGISSVSLSTAPATLDAVTAGDLERSVLPGIRALYVLGMNDGIFPSVSGSGGLLSQTERELLSQDFGLELRAGGMAKSYKDIYQFYVNLSKPSDRICLSCSLSGGEGKALEPSFVLEDITKLFGDFLTLCDITPKISVKSDAFRMISAKVNEPEGEFSVLEKALIRYFGRDPEYSARLEKLISLRGMNVGNESLGRESISSLFGRELRGSVTKLERYNSCPFSYFVRNILKAGERKVYEMKSLDIGNYFHSILDSFAQRLISIENWRTYSDSEIIDIAEDAINGILFREGAENEFFSINEQNLYFRHRVKAYTLASVNAVIDHLRKGSFDPKYTELGFFESPDDNDGIVLEPLERRLSDGTKMILEGRIDRVDIFGRDGEEYVKLIDYKSGEKKFDLLEAYYGLSFQLLVYMYMFIEKYTKKHGKTGLVHPAAALYFLVKNPVLSDEKIKAEAEENLLADFKMRGIVLKNEEIIKGLDSTLQSGSSSVIPIWLTGSGDGYHARNSSEIPAELFDLLLEYTVNKAFSAGEDIISGKIPVRPYRLKGVSGCKYCEYRPVCKFDPLLHSGKYNNMENIEKKEIYVKLRESGDE